MRYQRMLTPQQIDFIIKNPSAKNKDLSSVFLVPASIIASNKSRLRKKGYEIDLHRKKSQ